MPPPLVAQRAPVSPALSLYDSDDRNFLAASVQSSPESSKYMLQGDGNPAEASYEVQSTRWKVLTGVLFTLLSFLALYAFMVGIKLIENGLTLALGCDLKGAFDFANNPIAGLMIGTVATALIHSSSTVTSIVVALVGTGAMTVRQAVAVVMGANIGTCITCIIVAFAQVRDRKQFERAMAAATVHDMYNIWSVIVLFPIEVAFHPLERLAIAMADTDGANVDFESPVDAIVNPVVGQIVVLNKKFLTQVATGNVTCQTHRGEFIKSGAFKDIGLSEAANGGIIASIGFVVLILALVTLVRVMARLFLGPTKRIVARALDYNGYLNIFVGTLLTFWVQSSTLVTSTLTPMAGLGVITLEKVYPLMIGANLGTTSTGLLAALVTGKFDSLIIALVHVWFNVFGILLFYPIPSTRQPILVWATSLASWSAAWPFCAVIFIAICFVVVPAFGLALTYLCTADATVTKVFGWVLTALLVLCVTSVWYWYSESNGRERWSRFLDSKRTERLAHHRHDRSTVMNASADLSHDDTVPVV